MLSIQAQPLKAQLANRPQALTVSSARPQFAQSLSQAPQPKFSGLADIEWTPGKVFKTAILALSGLYAGVFGVRNMGYFENQPFERSIVFNCYDASDSPFEKNADGSIKVHEPGYHTTWFQQNYPFDIRPQRVKDTLQPYTKDGVIVDGSGQRPDEGVDFRLQYRIDSGSDNYKTSLQLLATEIVGSSEMNAKAPIFNRESVDFQTNDGPTMKMIYYGKILPMLEEAMNIATTQTFANNIHEKRAFIEGILRNGFSQEFVHADGTKTTHILIKPLADQFKENGLILENLELTKFDVPTFLTDLNQTRTNISIDKKTAKLETDKFKSEQENEVAKVKAEFAVFKEQKIGENQRLIAGELGTVNKATEAAKKTEQTALGYKAQLLAQATGNAKNMVTKAENEAAGIRRDANVYATEKLAEGNAHAAQILSKARAEASSLTALGEQLHAYPELIEQIRLQASAKNQAELADKVIGSMILAPGTSPVDVLRSITPNTLQVIPTPVAKPAETGK